MAPSTQVPTPPDAGGGHIESSGFKASKIGPRIKRWLRGRRTPMFESGEHTYVGNCATLYFGADDPEVPASERGVPASERYLQLENGLRLTYGNILALGGDFYGIPDRPISDGENQQQREFRFQAAFRTLAEDERAVKEVPLILKVLDEEITAVNAALLAGRQPSAAYAVLGDSLSKKWNRITGGGPNWVPAGRYLQLAATNWDHFVQHAVAAYQAGHRSAMLEAIRARGIEDDDERESALATAYAMNAFADHFMTDLFSSGHMRTPRRALYDGSLLPKEGSGYAARYMHDEDSMWGLYIYNRRGDTWIAYGDKKFGDSYNATNAALVMDAVQASIDEVYAAFTTGTFPDRPDQYAALKITPHIEAFQEPRHPGNFAAFFIVDDTGAVLARNDYGKLDDYRWNANWTVPGTLVRQMWWAHKTAPPERFLAPPAVAPSIQQWTSSDPSPPAWRDGARVRYAVSYFNEFWTPGRWYEWDEWGPAFNESDRGDWSDWAEVKGQYKPVIDIPIDGTGRAQGRVVYRQFKGAAPQRIGQVDDNTTTQYTDDNDGEGQGS